MINREVIALGTVTEWRWTLEIAEDEFCLNEVGFPIVVKVETLGRCDETRTIISVEITAEDLALLVSKKLNEVFHKKEGV
jgi:hypothetical protein